MSQSRNTATPEDDNESDVTQESAASRDDVRIYIGPTMHRRMMVTASVYRGGLNAHITGMITKVPEIASLIVPLSEVVEAKRRVKRQGTTEFGIYQYLLSIRFGADGAVRQ
ncbi:MAG: hypothetical protein LBU13_06830 [Synergistaceae bacterium]|jgi:hypothetical protein|nr:hypothetical protein [Synergistaceae bacterium]